MSVPTRESVISIAIFLRAFYMRLPDDRKRRQIIATAADMFAAQPYHKVRLDDVATAAGVGKGTLYVYFQSKEELYFTIIYEGVGLLLDRLKAQLAIETVGSNAMDRMRIIVDELVNFAFQHPEFFELLKTVAPPVNNPDWKAQRDDLFTVIERTIQAGVACGELHDPNPQLTSRLIPGLVRSSMLFGPNDLTPEVLKQHLSGLLSSALGAAPTAKISV